MKRAALVLFLAGAPMLGFAQIPGGGIQLSGILSANLIDDFNSNTAYSDNNNGYTYFQLNGSFRDGPFGMESQLQFGPSPGTGVSNLYIHYTYGYATVLNGILSMERSGGSSTSQRSALSATIRPDQTARASTETWQGKSEAAGSGSMESKSGLFPRQISFLELSSPTTSIHFPS